MRAVRWVLFFTFGLGLLFLVAWAVVRAYLTSPDIADRAAKLLAKSLGSPVQVGEADLNLESTVLRKVRLFEPHPSPDDAPWAVAEYLEADVPLIDAINGVASPRQVHLHQAHVTLRFD